MPSIVYKSPTRASQFLYPWKEDGGKELPDVEATEQTSRQRMEWLDAQHQIHLNLTLATTSENEGLKEGRT